MDEVIDLAEIEQLVARMQPEDREHRLRPEDAAAREVPVPQAAAPAIERSVDAPADRLVNYVGFAGTGRLPVESKAEDQHHEAGGRGKRHGECGIGAPWRERLRSRHVERDLAKRPMQVAHGHDGFGAVGERGFEDPRGRCEHREGLVGTEHVKQEMADRAAHGLSDHYGAFGIRYQNLGAGTVTIEHAVDRLLGDAGCILGG